MKKRRMISVLIVILVFIGLLLFKVANWVPSAFGDIPFEQVLFHIMVPMDGADSAVLDSFVSECLPMPIIVSCILLLLLIISDWKTSVDIKNGDLHHKTNCILTVISSICCLIVYVFGITDCIYAVGIDEYWYNVMHPSNIYEKYYVDPSSVNYTFPETKRNLVYIFMESMETTYEDTAHGGYFEESLIPELTELSENNLTFTNGDYSNNGFYAPAMSGWTAAALVGQTSGVPLNTPAGANSYLSDKSFLPGAYTLGDLLEDNGYQNEILLGSDAKFGGREYYFNLHGNYKIVDYYSAVENGWIDKDYYVWWGYEDLKLFEFAKNELTNLAAGGQPFNFNMLTADTHFVGGYPCEECEDLYGDQYSNVIRCSSKHVTELVQWIQQQDWYANTTIVLAGDHKSMDNDWFKDIEDGGYDRKVYYTIVNPAISPATQNSRTVSTYDLYPTTVASLGITYDSPRLGLGTNLFTDTPTVVEEIGYKKLNKQTMMHSNYYDKYILYGKSKK